jgi:hypothetical protein
MARRLRVLYLQLPVPDFAYDYWGADHPLAGGYLAAYALARGVAHEPLFLPPSLTSFASDAALVRSVLDLGPDVVAATLHLWNAERCARILGQVKAVRPGLRALAGGPEAAGEFSERFAGHPFDWVHDGEGEGAFAGVLERLSADPSNPTLAGAAAGAPREVPLEALPSPYLTGLLPLAPDGSAWVETMRGCPFGCEYCRYGKSFSGMRWFPESWLEQHLAWARGREAREVYFLDPSFQIAPALARRLERLAVWNPGGMALHTEARVDGMTAGLARAFARAGFTSMETGLQSIHTHVLRGIGRTADIKAFARGAARLVREGLRLQIDVMLGLPHDTPEGFLQTLDFLVEHGLSQWVSIYPLLALPGTPLRDKAAGMGLRFRPRPPYQVEQTPHFSLEGLRQAMAGAEGRLGLGVFPLHLPDLTPKDSAGGLVGLVDVELAAGGRVGLGQDVSGRLAQCPVFLFHAGEGELPWEAMRAWGAWQRRHLPTLMPFWGIRTERPFSLAELAETIRALHEPQAYQSGVWSLAPDPYLRLSCRPFVLSSCPGDPGFWLRVNDLVPVIRHTDRLPVGGRDDPLGRLPVLWETRGALGRRILASVQPAFHGREEELLFSRRENARAWAELTGLPSPPPGQPQARVRAP